MHNNSQLYTCNHLDKTKIIKRLHLDNKKMKQTLITSRFRSLTFFTVTVVRLALSEMLPPGFNCNDQSWLEQWSTKTTFSKFKEKQVKTNLRITVTTMITSWCHDNYFFEVWDVCLLLRLTSKEKSFNLIHWQWIVDKPQNYGSYSCFCLFLLPWMNILLISIRKCITY